MSTAGLRLRLLSLDATGTLMKVQGSVADHYVAAAKRHAPNWPKLDPRAVLRGFLDSYRCQARSLPAFGSRKGVSTEAWWETVVCGALLEGLRASPSYSVTDLPLSEAKLRQSGEFRAVFSELYSSFATKNCWQVFPDALDLLLELQPLRPALRLAVVSNFDERLHQILQELGLRELIDEVITSREAGVEKPDPSIFLLTLERCGLKPQDAHLALHVGDHRRNDYQGPKELRMRAKWLVRNPSLETEAPLGEKTGSEQDDVLHDLSSLAQIAKKEAMSTQ